MICSICGKKIRWWQKARPILYNKYMMNDANDGKIHHPGEVIESEWLACHQKCWPDCMYPGMDYGYTAAKKEQEKP